MPRKPPVPETKRTNRARATFLATLADSCNVSASCRAAGIGRTLAYRWRDEDESFAADWKNAEDEAVDKLEQTAWDRANIDKSDRMLEILLKAHRPNKYVERRLVGSDPENPLPSGFSVQLVKGREVE